MKSKVTEKKAPKKSAPKKTTKTVEKKKAPVKKAGTSGKAPKSGKVLKKKHSKEDTSDHAPTSKRSVADREVSDPKAFKKYRAELAAADEALAAAEERRQEVIPRLRDAVGSSSYVDPDSGISLTLQKRDGKWFVRNTPVRH